MKTAVIIPAAGAATRMGKQKQLMMLSGKPVIFHTIEAFEYHDDIDEIIVVAGGEVADAVEYYGFDKVTAIVDGKDSRQDSVRAGLAEVSADTAFVLVHDGARPLVSDRVISDVLVRVKHGLCAIAGVKAKDTVKIADENGLVIDTPDRENAWLVQTPQGFPRHILEEAHQKANFIGTDDASLVERLGIPVCMVEGDYRNIKLTTPDDLRMAEVYIMGD